MTYQITHSIQYLFEPAVELAPHDIRLQPRTDAYQSLQYFNLEIAPAPLRQSLILDSLGNLVTRCWWPSSRISTLVITAQSRVSTHCDNPFEYLLEPWANQLPMDYPRSLFESLSPYLQSSREVLGHSATVAEWAHTLLADCDFNPSSFLFMLNQTIYEQWTYQERLDGAPLPPAVTWRSRQGSCRDLVVLLMSACTAVGLASRFVSGYEEGSPEHQQTLHAWAEVYLPGAGWRGYDPTLGLAVSDRHVALAAHCFPELTTPVLGQYRGQTKSQISPHVDIRRFTAQDG